MEALVEQLTKHIDTHATAHQSALEKLAQKSAERDAELEVQVTGLRNEMQTTRQQAYARGGGGSGSSSLTPGDLVVASERVRELAAATGQKGSARIELGTKTITSLPDSAGALVVPARDTLVPLPQQRPTVRDLLNIVGVSSGSVEYPRMKTRTNAAAIVEPEGSLKPESSLDFDLVTTPIKTIAHWLICSRQILDDAPQLRSIVSSELIWGLRYEEEQELLYGDGLTSHLLGMVPQATTFSAPIAIPSATTMDVIAQAAEQVAQNDYEATGVIINSKDWLKMRTQKASDGTYLLGNPQVDVRPQLWGLNVVSTKSMVAGSFLVGDFRTVSLYDRLSPAILISSEDRDHLIRNLVTILAEERVGIAAKAPKALVHGTFA